MLHVAPLSMKLSIHKMLEDCCHGGFATIICQIMYRPLAGNCPCYANVWAARRIQHSRLLCESWWDCNHSHVRTFLDVVPISALVNALPQYRITIKLNLAQKVLQVMKFLNQFEFPTTKAVAFSQSDDIFQDS